MKKHLLLLTIFFLGLQIAYSSTNVSGGIYSNTTWTKANSPYIVTDTVVVFPGVTLTIQPGVVVQFDTNVELEIRQATLIAMGTPTDSITFTSNSSSPTPGSWSVVALNGVSSTSSRFFYCNFYYSLYGLGGGGTNTVTYVKKSTFKHNTNGISNCFCF
jgi:hypothetical protein